MRSPSAFVSTPEFLALLQQTKAKVQQARDAGVGGAIKESIPLTSERDDSPVGQPLELVGNGLRGHFDFCGKVRHAKLTCALKGVKQTKPRLTCQHFEQSTEFIGTRPFHERTLSQGRFTGVRCYSHSTWCLLHSHTITPYCVTVCRSI